MWWVKKLRVILDTIKQVTLKALWWYAAGMEKIKIEHHTLSGGLWFAAWLFTIGFLPLSFAQGVLAIILWPYYLGLALSNFLN